MALRQSPQVKAAGFARETARVQADRDKPVARPTLNATASGTVQGPRVTFPRPDGTLATVLPEEAGRLDLVLEQPLFRAGLKPAQALYRARYAVADEEYRKTLSDLALTVRKAYIDVLRGESGVRSAREGVEAASRYQDLVKHQIEAGIAKPVDAETVKAQVAEAQGGLRKAEGGLSLAIANFNRSLGRPLTIPVLLETTVTPTIPDSPDAAIAEALRNRSELRLLALNLQAAQAGVSLAKAQSQPMLNARGQVTEQTPSAFLHEHYAAATLELRIPILDGGKTRLDTEEAKAQVGRLEALQEESRQGIALDVTQAWQKMREAQDQITLAQTRRSGAEATATVAEKAYEVGRSTVIEVQTAQREVRLAKERELQAIYDLQTAAAEFDAARGVLLTGLNLASLPAGKK